MLCQLLLFVVCFGCLVVSDSFVIPYCRLPGSFVQGIFQARIVSGLPFPTPYYTIQCGNNSVLAGYVLFDCLHQATCWFPNQGSPVPPAMEVQSLNHCTAWKILGKYVLKESLMPLILCPVHLSYFKQNLSFCFLNVLPAICYTET